jgi:hypothetical protein
MIFFNWLYFGFILLTIYLVLDILNFQGWKEFWIGIAIWWTFNLAMIGIFHV